MKKLSILICGREMNNCVSDLEFGRGENSLFTDTLEGNGNIVGGGRGNGQDGMHVDWVNWGEGWGDGDGIGDGDGDGWEEMHKKHKNDERDEDLKIWKATS